MSIVTRAEILIYLGKTTSLTASEMALIDLLHPMVEANIKQYLQQDLEQATHVEYLPIGESVRSEGVLRDSVEVNATSVRFIESSDRSSVLQLKHLPVVLSSIEVREDPGAYAGQGNDSEAFDSDTILTRGSDYFLDVDDPASNLSRTGILHRIGVWPTEPRSVMVTYLGGFTVAQFAAAIAGPIRYATLLEVNRAFKQASVLQISHGPITSERFGKYEYTSQGGSSSIYGGMTTDFSAEAKRLLQPYRNYGRLF